MSWKCPLLSEKWVSTEARYSLVSLHTHLGHHTHTRSEMENAQNSIFFPSKSDVCMKRAIPVVCVLMCNHAACGFFAAALPSPAGAPPHHVCACTLLFFGIHQVMLNLNESESLAGACCVASRTVPATDTN